MSTNSDATETTAVPHTVWSGLFKPVQKCFLTDFNSKNRYWDISKMSPASKKSNMCAGNIYNHMWNGDTGLLNPKGPNRSERCYCLAPEGSPEGHQSSPCSETLSWGSEQIRGLTWTAQVKTGPRCLVELDRTD